MPGLPLWHSPRGQQPGATPPGRTAPPHRGGLAGHAAAARQLSATHRRAARAVSAPAWQELPGAPWPSELPGLLVPPALVWLPDAPYLSNQEACRCYTPGQGGQPLYTPAPVAGLPAPDLLYSQWPHQLLRRRRRSDRHSDRHSNRHSDRHSDRSRDRDRSDRGSRGSSGRAGPLYKPRARRQCCIRRY